MNNVFGDALDRITGEEFIAALKSMSIETGRLEFKRDGVSREKVAEAAAAMANADGGIVAIGFIDPAGEELQPSGGPVDTSNDAITSWYSAIHARIHPPINMEIRGYNLPDGVYFVVVRIEPNLRAPHEFVARDGTRSMPVRRGSTTSRLTLAEINAHIARQDNSSPKSWLSHKPPLFPIRTGLSDAKYFGACVTPSAFAPTRRILNKKDSHALGQIITAIVGNNLSPTLIPVSLPEAEAYFDVNPRTTRPDGATTFNFGAASRIIHFRADSEVTLRTTISAEPRNYLDEWLKFLLAVHVAANSAFNYFRVGPRGRLTLGHFLGSGRLRSEPVLAQQFDDSFEIDFSSQSFADAFTPSVMLCLRADAGSPDEDAIATTLNEAYFGHLKTVDLRNDWL